ncbi:hypothetical protein F5882DRAFT_101083 [Hyaloscypha sp. PMI_1271]|nr:hypothetical protein F5882DRAFT_101083 [Hyaloscypha sp. PMI_1271]
MSVTPNPANLLMHLLVNATMRAIPVTCPPNLGQSGFVEGKKEPGVHPLPALGGYPNCRSRPHLAVFPRPHCRQLFCLAAIPS